jgi:hypothetical protein
LTRYVTKVQTYKIVSEALPLVVHEEIVELDKSEITRYCVVYELVQHQTTSQVRSLS